MGLNFINDDQEIFIERNTGDSIICQVITKEIDDVDIVIFWRKEILRLIGEYSDTKFQILNWLIDSRNSKDCVVATKDEIAEANNVSRVTVTRLLTSLQQANLVDQLKRSTWKLSANLLQTNPAESSVLIHYVRPK